MVGIRFSVAVTCPNIRTFNERPPHAGHGRVDIREVRILPDVLQQRPGVGEALQDRVHEAGVPDVLQSIEAHLPDADDGGGLVPDGIPVGAVPRDAVQRGRARGGRGAAGEGIPADAGRRRDVLEATHSGG